MVPHPKKPGKMMKNVAQLVGPPTFVADLMLQFLGKRCDHLGQTRHSERLDKTLGPWFLTWKIAGEMMVK